VVHHHGTPTTLAGYGITDSFTQAAADARYAPIAHNQAWSTITGTPTTLAGYGIVDAYTKVQVDTGLAGKASLAGGNALSGAQLLTSTAVGQIPLAVKGVIGQTANLFEAQSPTATILAKLDSAGRLGLGIGTATPAGTFDLLGTSVQNYTETGFTAIRPVAAQMHFSAAPSSTYGTTAIDFHGIDLVGEGTNANVNSTTGIYPIETTAQYSGTGTIGRLVSLYTLGNNTSSGTVAANMTLLQQLGRNTGTGVIANLYGTFFRTPTNSGTSSITNIYGVYSQPLLDGSSLPVATNNNINILVGNPPNGPINAGLYLSTDTAYFGGKVGIGIQPAATNRLTANDVRLELSGTPASYAFTADYAPPSITTAPIDLTAITTLARTSSTTIGSGLLRLYGTQSRAGLYSTGVANTLIGVLGEALTQQTGGTSFNAIGVNALIQATAGAIGSAYGFKAEAPTKGASGSISTYYGVHVSQPTVATTNYAIYTTGGTTLLNAGTVGTTALMVRGAASQTADLQQWQDSAGAVLARTNKAGYRIISRTAAPADADLAAGELTQWFDQTTGAAKLMIKGKNAAGTVVTGQVALT
jgi:hypothetical protein